MKSLIEFIYFFDFILYFVDLCYDCFRRL